MRASAVAGFELSKQSVLKGDLLWHRFDDKVRRLGRWFRHSRHTMGQGAMAGRISAKHDRLEAGTRKGQRDASAHGAVSHDHHAADGMFVFFVHATASLPHVWTQYDRSSEGSHG